MSLKQKSYWLEHGLMDTGEMSADTFKLQENHKNFLDKLFSEHAFLESDFNRFLYDTFEPMYGKETYKIMAKLVEKGLIK